MKGMFLVCIELVVTLAAASKLPIHTIWECCAFVMAVMAIPTGFAIAKKHGSQLLTIAAVYAVVGSVGGFFAPDGYHQAIWCVAGIAALTTFVLGMIRVFGLEECPTKHYNHVRETADEDGVMYNRRRQRRA